MYTCIASLSFLFYPLLTFLHNVLFTSSSNNGANNDANGCRLLVLSVTRSCSSSLSSVLRAHVQTYSSLKKYSAAVDSKPSNDGVPDTSTYVSV